MAVNYFVLGRTQDETTCPDLQCAAVEADNDPYEGELLCTTSLTNLRYRFTSPKRPMKICITRLILLLN
mgnify:CR=1 FL=1